MGPLPRQLLQRDLGWSVLILVVNSLLLLPKASHHGPAVLAPLFAVSASCLLVIWLAWRRLPCYSRHRSALLAGTRLLRVLAVQQVHRQAPNFYRPEQLPGNPFLALFRMSTRGIFLGATAFGYRLPMAWHLPTQLASTALVVMLLPGRCALECAVEGQAERYAGYAAWLRCAADLLWVGLPAPLRPRCGCLVVSAWFDTFLGLLLPTWLLARADAAAESPEGGGMARLAAAAYHPGVLFAGAALAWRVAKAADVLIGSS